MQACLVIMTITAGTGVKTITGVVDHTGAPFLGETFLFVGNSGLNALEYAVGTSTPGARLSLGIDDTSAVHQCFGMENNISGSGGREDCAGVSDQFSVGSMHSQTFFGGAWWRLGYVSAVRSGEFDVTLTTNVLSGDSYLVLVLAGGDASYGYVSNVASHYPTTHAPVTGVLFASEIFPIGGTHTGTTAQGSLGWGSAQLAPPAQAVMSIATAISGNSRRLPITAATDPLSNLRSLTGFPSDGFDLTAGPIGASYVAFSGCACASGVLTQPTTTGPQTIVTGIQNRFVLLAAINDPASDVWNAGAAEWSLGMADGTRQGAYWTGESAINQDPLTGARYLSDTDVIRCATPNAGSTTFSSLAQMTGFDDATHSFTLDWTTVSGAADHSVAWFAIGEAPVVTTVTYPIRRMRRFPLPFNENKQMFLSRLELIMQTGIGTALIEHPTVMLRLSRDGGVTWGAERQMSAGAMGDYLHRVFVTRLGRGRNWVAEVTVSDPVNWQWVQCTIDIQTGTS